jgi:hypothetical protein
VLFYSSTLIRFTFLHRHLISYRFEIFIKPEIPTKLNPSLPTTNMQPSYYCALCALLTKIYEGLNIKNRTTALNQHVNSSHEQFKIPPTIPGGRNQSLPRRSALLLALWAVVDPDNNAQDQVMPSNGISFHF